MLVFKSFYCALAVVLLWSLDYASGHSQASRPLKRLAHPSTLSIEILPRKPSSLSGLEARHASLKSGTLRYTDSFRLILSAFDDTFYLHLRPNDHLIHPAARITYHGPSGTHTKPLLRESVKAYWGEVIHESYTAERMREDTAGVVPRPNYEPGKELGWARIIVWHQGDVDVGKSPVFEGAFEANGVIYHIMTRDNYLRTKQVLDPELVQSLGGDDELVIWRDSDVMSEEEFYGNMPGESVVKAQSCGHDKLEWNVNPELNPVLQRQPSSSSWFGFEDTTFNLGSLGNLSLARRDDVAGNGMSTNFINNIGQKDGCPTTQKVLYMGVAADCKYVSQYGSPENATQKILNDWNAASSLYKNTFNVSLGIVELQVQTATCPSQPDPSKPWNVDCTNVKLDERLSLFSQWRGDKGNDGIGLWHLMSGCPTGTEVGIAWLATLCQQSAAGSPGSVVSGTGVSTAGLTEWQVIAHEIGHNFGAIHDCADGCNSSSNCCPLSVSTCNANAKFIMSPVAQAGEHDFSACSIGNVCSLMKGVQGGKTDTTCLIDPSDSTRQTISLQMCGNGIVEEGEDCDPGNGANSTCCDSATCKFKNGAVCDPMSSPCCTQQCSFAPSTQVCRPAKDDRCDTAETCTGTSAQCPKDIMKPNGQSCSNDGLACASGTCTSVAAQCQSVGASMGLKNACPNRGDNTCQISCQDPQRANSCVLLSSLLIDGSPCGYGGTCVSGRCQSGSLLDTAKAWYTQNLQIAIPVTVVAGIIVLLFLFAIIRGK
ncbi:zinc metalloprotease [Moniliophthora roreri MCA 2997]|uniref:Disintegrin and metalloproteinase domain-containing protein B n=1 Tax=Moniliophthora roreri (strain MCA 2997) TaxID=1381753 RepID=V2XWK7_MONRO|nr:zinc metalloprotease [Moniliophthora roreri MCA 2997]